ncbi:MAG: GspE/PulE family protein [Thermoleophilia bacterium]|jgi:type IV pilus assembly protein PilB
MRATQAPGEEILRNRLWRKRAVEILVAEGLLTNEQSQQALAQQQTDTEAWIDDIALSRKWVTKDHLMKTLAHSIGVTYVDLPAVQVDPAAARLLSQRDAHRYKVLPLAYLNDHTILVAMAEPSNIVTIDDLRILTGLDIEPALADRGEIIAALSKLRGAADQVSAQLNIYSGEDNQAGPDEPKDIREQVDAPPVVRLVNDILARAVDEGASDIHFEPQEGGLLVRFRHDGVLHRTMTIPKRLQAGVLSRLKIMADLDIAERRIPQDGCIDLFVSGRPIDLRVASLPTVFGEKIAVRLLDRSTAVLRLEQLGFSIQAMEQYERSFRKPYGAILVTGPTGSGKSTTLYATLNILNTVEKNIITVEDPVEYRLAGINQVQINPKAGLTFASGLRSILRCDPDIVMVGEIRDKETARIAIESALTGHLVLSTLHTNDAPGALTRLTEMGVEPFLTASAVDCVIAQRLVRKLCEHCRESYQPGPTALKNYQFPSQLLNSWDHKTLYRAVGCNRCSNTGYKGRLGLYETMPITEAIEGLIVERRNVDEIGRVARAEGMLSLRDDGLRRVVEGVTTMEEISRVIV